MANNQGKGLREWQAGLTAAQRRKHARLGGIARAGKLSAKRRSEIAKLGAKVRAAGILARKQALSDG